MKRHTPAACLLVLGLCAFAVRASAQDPLLPFEDFFKINYFSNNGVAGAPDATVRIDNPGSPVIVSVGGGEGEGGAINLCAMIYVFDNDQQLTECCGCLVTPDGLRTLSVTHDLTSNPLTGVVSKNGVILLASTLVNDAPCDPTAESLEVATTLRAWGTHIQNKVGTAYPITETPFSNINLTEASGIIVEECAFAHSLGSGKGVCTCGTGD